MRINKHSIDFPFNSGSFDYIFPTKSGTIALLDDVQGAGAGGGVELYEYNFIIYGSDSSGKIIYVNLTCYTPINMGYNLNQEYTNVSVDSIWGMLLAMNDNDANFHFRNVNGYVETGENPIFDIFGSENNVQVLYYQYALPERNSKGNGSFDRTPNTYRTFLTVKKILGTTATLATN